MGGTGAWKRWQLCGTATRGWGVWVWWSICLEALLFFSTEIEECKSHWDPIGASENCGHDGRSPLFTSEARCRREVFVCHCIGFSFNPHSVCTFAGREKRLIVL